MILYLTDINNVLSIQRGDIMRCPKCNSERIQFGTNTSGGGFSLSNSCCGMIALGPMGALCGACSSSTHTEEFWICQDCGKKFDTKEGQEAQKTFEAKQQDKETAKKNYIESKKLKSDILKKYGSIEEFNKDLEVAQQNFEEKNRAYDSAYEHFIKSGDKKIQKKYKQSQYTDKVISKGIIACILLTGVFAGLFPPLAFVTGGVGVFLFFRSVFKETKADMCKEQLSELFVNSSAEALLLHEGVVSAANEFLRLNNISEKINYCNFYKKNNIVE